LAHNQDIWLRAYDIWLTAKEFGLGPRTFGLSPKTFEWCANGLIHASCLDLMVANVVKSKKLIKNIAVNMEVAK